MANWAFASFKHSILLSFLGLFVLNGSCTKLFVSHYAGNVSSLSIRGDLLKEESSLQACGPSPSWLTYDSRGRTLYCSDETYLCGLGSLSAFKEDEHVLTEDVKVDAPRGGVANILYGGKQGPGFIAVAHYQISQVSTFKLPLKSSSTTQQVFTYTMDQPGPNPARQDRPHPHQTLIDPTGSFLLAPDLGADITHVYAIDKESGQLTECPGLNSPPGAGPRHAAFWTSKAAQPHPHTRPPVTMFYVLNELSNQVIAYYVRYPSSGCLSFVQTQALSPYPNNEPAPVGATAAEIHIKDDFLYTSNRNDSSFAGNDSIATWSIAKNGTLVFQELSSSYGSYPRTFSINKAGDRVAIGNQVTASVAVVSRNPKTGALGDLIASLRVGPEGVAGTNTGLSSVVWAE